MQAVKRTDNKKVLVLKTKILSNLKKKLLTFLLGVLYDKIDHVVGVLCYCEKHKYIIEEKLRQKSNL